MRAVFKNPELNRKLLKDGFVVIPSFLNNEELSDIQDAYKSFKPEMDAKGYYSSIDSYDQAYKSHVSQSIKRVIARSSFIYYDNYRPLTGNFVFKPKGERSKVYMHFDISCVDEEHYESTVLWVPLCDTDEINGALHMLRGSHHFMNKIRGPGVPRYYENLYDFFEKNYMEPFPMKAGDAMIFINRILHYSPINKKKNERVSFRIDMIPAEAEPIIYYWSEDMPQDEVNVYKIDETFYEFFRKETKPLNVDFIGVKKNAFQELPKPELIKKIEEEFVDKKIINRNRKNSQIKNFFKKILG